VAKEASGRRAADLTLAQIESNLQETLAEVMSSDAVENMPIGRVEQAVANAIREQGLQWWPIPELPDVKCRVECQYIYVPFSKGTLVCRLVCDIG
jgi:hypothetical protein